MAAELGPVPGWQHASFAAPIPISANTTYVAAYYAPNGLGAKTTEGLANGVAAGPLNAPAGASIGGNGIFAYGYFGFPSQIYENTNYFVDVVFIPVTSAPYLTLALYPANPSVVSSAPLGSYVATISAIWSNGAPFTGTLSFGSPYSNDSNVFSISGNELIINPSGPGVSADRDTLQNITIIATQ